MKNLKPKDVNKYFMIALLLGFLIAMAGATTEIMFLIVIGIITMFASIPFKILFYKCPHCNKFLDRSTGEFCPYCGKKVNE